jgi:raffinose/stachyose/melibiose transport system substrate-binding protein
MKSSENQFVWRWGAAISAIILLMLFSACGGKERVEQIPEPPQTALSLWGWIVSGSPEERIIEEAVSEFNRENPYGAAIDYQTFHDDFKIKIVMEAAANNTPDMFFTWEEGFLDPFVKSGKVLSLDSMIDSSRFIPGILDHVTVDGSIYAMPLAQTVQLVFYNKELFESNGISEPQTMDELLEAVRIFRSQGIVPFALGNKEIWPAGLILNTLAYRYGGGGLFRAVAGGDELFTDKAFVSASRDFKRLVDAGAFEPNANSIDLDTSRRAFMEGRSAMWVMGSWEMSVLTAKTDKNGRPNLLYDNLGFFNWPSVENGANGQDAWIVAPDYNIAVSRGVKNKEAAAYFLKLVSSPKYQDRLSTILQLPATNFNVNDLLVNSLTYELLNQLKDAKETVTFPDRIMGQQTIGGAVNNSAQELLAGQGIEETMQLLEERAQSFRGDDSAGP